MTSDQLKMANDHAMMILATLVYQDLANHSSPTDSLSRLSILTYFKYCLKQFQLQFPEAAKHVGDLLDANALVVRKTERDLHKNYVERLQIHQLALEHRCQTIQPIHSLSDHLFQRPSQVVRQQFVNTKSQEQPSRPLSLTPGNQRQITPSRRKLFDRRTEKPVSSPHPYSSALKEISLKLKDTQKKKLLGNLCFNKIEESEVAKQPEKFLHILFEKELGKVPADPCKHILKKLRITGDKDLQSSANKLLSKRKSDLSKEEDVDKSDTPMRRLGTGVLDSRKTPQFSKTIKPGTKDFGEVITGAAVPGDNGSQHASQRDIPGIHRSTSESALRQHDSSYEMHEKLDRLLSEMELVKQALQNQAEYHSPVGMGAVGLRFPTNPAF